MFTQTQIALFNFLKDFFLQEVNQKFKQDLIKIFKVFFHLKIIAIIYYIRNLILILWLPEKYQNAHKLTISCSFNNWKKKINSLGSFWINKKKIPKEDIIWKYGSLSIKI